MGCFRYSNTLSMIEFYFCRTLVILKGQIEDKKYFLEWGLNPRTHEPRIYFMSEILKYFVRFLVQMKTVEFAFEII